VAVKATTLTFSQVAAVKQGASGVTLELASGKPASAWPTCACSSESPKRPRAGGSFIGRRAAGQFSIASNALK
jgi:hypothetical protein